MRGKWLPNLFLRVITGSITPSESWSFLKWRMLHQEPTLTIEGLHFKGMDHIMWRLIANIFLTREYSPRGYQIGENDLVIDIGAHKGAFVGYSAKRTKNQIIAIEPDPENFVCIEQFIQINGLRNVDLRNLAVSKITGEAMMYRADRSSRHSFTGFDQITGEQLKDSFKVQTISINEVLAPLSKIDLLKMDCEGAEYDILLSVADKEIIKIRRLVFEVHWLDREDLLETLLERLQSIFDEVFLVRTSEVLGIIYARQLQ